MDRTGAIAWTWARTGLMAAVLMTLGVAGCGDDDDGSTGSETGSEQADDSGDAAGDSGGESSDVCSLLTTAEVDAQFGEAGAVADPRLELGSCVWEIGEQGEDGSGDLFTLYRFVGDSSRSLGENWGIDLSSSGESLDGIGDEAWINDDGSQLLLNRGNVYISLSNAFGSVIGSDLAGVREKMIALAELVAGRV